MVMATSSPPPASSPLPAAAASSPSPAPSSELVLTPSPSPGTGAGTGAGVEAGEGGEVGPRELDYVSPPEGIRLEEYAYTKLPPLPREYVLSPPDQADSDAEGGGDEGAEGEAGGKKGSKKGKMEAILGHEMKKAELWYFVELSDGRVERRPAEEVQKHKDLLRIYEMKSRNGKLPAFDPRTDRRLNPLKVKIDLRRQSSIRSPSYEPSPLTSLPTSEADDNNASDGTYEEEEEEETPRPLRRRTRKNVVGAARMLGVRRPGPSPKKTRARVGKMRVLDESFFSEDDGESEVWTASEQEEEEESESEYSRGRGKGRRSRAAAKKGKKATPQPVFLELGDIAEFTKHSPSELELAKKDPLHAHRDTCEKCRQKPAHLLPKKRGRKQGKARRGKYDETLSGDEADEKLPEELGGWLRCVKCCLAAHWDCVSPMQRLEVMRAVRQKTGNEFWQGLPMGEASAFVCGACKRGMACIGCGERVPDSVEEKDGTPAVSHGEKKAAVEAGARSTSVPAKEQSESKEEPMTEIAGTEKVPEKASSTEPMDVDDEPVESTVNAKPAESEDALLFRCTRCKRASHYRCLPNPPRALALLKEPPLPLKDVARHYQQTWECAHCERWRFPVELILAWRPAPGVKPEEEARKEVNYKDPLKREYLIKWEKRSFARVEWVPHDWLLAVAGAKLKNFLDGGRKIELLAEGGAVGFETSSAGPPGPEPDAESRIPASWKRIDRLLDVRFWKPAGKKKRKPSKPPPARKTRASVRGNAQVSESEVEDDVDVDDDPIESWDTDEEEVELRVPIMREGEEPDEDETEDVGARVRRLRKENGRNADLSEADMKDLAWCYIKWEELGYEQATWDTPWPREGPAFPGMEKAFRTFLQGRAISHKPMKAEELERLDRTYQKVGKPTNLKEDPELANGGKLFPFQLDGVNWLWLQWWQRRSAILADEMGLGKTVQVITFLNLIHTRFQVSPFLVVVPNSTITNWTREFARWAPDLHVVPYFGDAAARKIIRNFELFETDRSGYEGPRKPELKTHVVITTYEGITNAKDAAERSVFNSVNRWEVLVVDESQKLKNDASLIFRRLNEINSAHRVLMTGTPLNNNIRELFNLMHFLDADNWNDLARLEREYAELDEEKIKQLHSELKPYFLRRTKEEELDLPARNEVIVPLSMSTLQKEVYRGLLSKNAELIGQLVGNISALTTKAAQIKKGSLNNLLMELRKCLAHPYLVSRDLEPQGLPDDELHRILVAASTKLVFLQTMLRQLKERGHRVLLFSQFVIALDIVEDFLVAEGYKYMRLDGSTKQSERQKGMDQFNEEGSQYFIYLLTTRAGGVGINLTSADTVIVFDPDFNPHMDHQAIARAHRIGQTKPVLVFKLMVKGSAEEKIVQVGKKKLVLDHLIVQKMDGDDEGMDDVQTILSFGARALFEEEAGKKIEDITYSEQDIHDLIVKTEDEAKMLTENKSAAKGKGLTFDFAKVWEASKGALAELPDDTPGDQQHDTLQDFWESVAKRAAAEEAERQSKIILGRGGKRAARAAAAAAAAAVAAAEELGDDELQSDKPKKKARKDKGKPDDSSQVPNQDDSDASDFVVPSQESSSDDDEDSVVGLVSGRLSPDDTDVYLPTPEKANNSMREKKEAQMSTLKVTMNNTGTAAMPVQPRPAEFSTGTVTSAAIGTWSHNSAYVPFAANAALQAGPSYPNAASALRQPMQYQFKLPNTPAVPALLSDPNIGSVSRVTHPTIRYSQQSTVNQFPLVSTSSIPSSSVPLQNGQLPHGQAGVGGPPIISHSTYPLPRQGIFVTAPAPAASAPRTASVVPSPPIAATAKRRRTPDSDDGSDIDESGPCPFCGDVHAVGNCPNLQDVGALEGVKRRILASNEPDEEKVAALVAINELLQAAYKQAANPARPRAVVPQPQPKSLPSPIATPGSNGASSEKIGPPRKKRKASSNQQASSATSSPLKQNIPPSPQEKRVRSQAGAPVAQTNLMQQCPVCGGRMHGPSQCLALASSALAIKRAIKNLEDDPRYTTYVSELKSLMLKRHGLKYDDTPSRSASGPIRTGIQAIPVNVTIQTLGSSPNGSRRNGSAPSSQSRPGPEPGLGPSASPPTIPFPCLLCHLQDHKTHECPKIQQMSDNKLKSTYNALKRPPEDYPREDVGRTMSALMRRRGELKGMEREKKRQQLARSDVIELSD